MDQKSALAQKKTWSTPKLVVYGDAVKLTAGVGQPKVGGSQDDLHTMSNPKSGGN